ncbi:heterokaryon incompatibility protein-domain-containing protein [Clohesyomyces aquaticus]|uniref:Heterokaryon incompatibility protein-domain-containing protein n=1 Tax=Clohesyomyces aquaticus TaxID=1231657 RepID=A0A1Y1ZLK7_9PLEO|nr:heterokaryon incompatibility protein-domain-containing protein [Clohesyomyces aquaticus]
MELLSPVPRYKYRPLENSTTIRVLVLYAASDFSARLVADIVHVDRKDLLRPMNSQDYPECCRFYEAVSYCWGDPIFTCQLALENGTSFLQITPNVDAMLRRMRRPHKSKYLWIDALSLNQADDVEKSHQVQLMGEIYQQAKKVLFWMGEENGQPISALFNYLNFMAKEFPRWMDKSYNDWQAQFMEQYPGALHNYLSRPWFWRRWIVQEAILGVDSTILCGEHKMDWKVFRFAVQRILSIKDYLPEHSPHPTPFPQSSSQLVNADLLRAINQVIALGAAPSKILHRMMEFRAAECSDPRDRIFALFGVVNDIYEPSNPSPNLSNSLGIAFSVDYSKPWNVVYCEFAKACVEAGHGNEILSHAAHFGSLSHADSLRPSWKWRWARNSVRTTFRPVTDTDPLHPIYNIN